MVKPWTALGVEAVKAILGSGEFASIDAACPDIAAALGRQSITPGTVLRGFRRVGEQQPPSSFLRLPPRNVAIPAGDVLIKPLDHLVERYGSAAETRYVRGLERKTGQLEYLAQRLEASISSAFERCPIKLGDGKIKARARPGRRMITAMVSDAHFGLNVDRREVPGGEYNWQIASRRMARLGTEIAAWKPQYREDTDLELVFNGDILAGLIHLDDGGIRKITEQIHGASWILIGFIDYLKQHFARVNVEMLPGNHDRITRERQISQRWDSHAHAVYLAVANAFRTENRIKFNVPLTGDATVELPGGQSLALYSHGDVRPTVANVGKSLDIKPMVAALNRINASGEYPKPVRVFGVGHWHVPFTMNSGNCTILVNGSAIGPDAFARNGCGVVGREGQPMQAMFESVPGYEFGDCRFIHLREADNDPAYDKIITTPSLDVWAA
jgi:hypothetical protein